jgi:DNA-directed RNA polymerase specialized sigma24 family protein
VADWEQAMVTLARERGGALKRYAFLLSGDDADAEAEAYVRRILLNRFLDTRRRRQGWFRVRPLVATAEEAPDPMAAAVDRADVRVALAGLTPRQRACTVLRYYEDLPVAEIADALGCSDGTVKRHLSDAHTRLAAALTPGSAYGPAYGSASPGPYQTMDTEEDARWNPAPKK